MPESQIVETTQRAISAEGISLCPESATCILAAERLLAEERITPDDQIVLFNTGAATKYVETVNLDLPVIDRPLNVDYNSLVR